ncbi:glycosyltransferase family 2 protein [soil metagenome]
MPLITVFTPTFNRANKLHRVYESLQKQTFRDFEWIIVDDGSTDNTIEVVEGYKKLKNDFEIRYYRQQNAGKHIAVNAGVKLAQGYFFHIADSDDAIEATTLQEFLNAWQIIPAEQKQFYCGIWACCKDQFGNRVSDPVPEKTYIGNLRDLFYKHRFRKEAFHIYLTSVMKEFPFPDNLTNLYYPEGIIWRKMTDKYLIKLIDKELRIYYIENTGDSIMSYRKPAKSRALSRCLESTEILNNDLSWFFYYQSYFLKAALVYASFRPFLSKEEKQNFRLKDKAPLLYLPLMIPGMIVNFIFRVKDAYVHSQNKTK